jgi:putative peptidoglycan lipid II flippase
LLGDVVIAAIYRTGHFQHNDVLFVWAVLAGSSVGLLASTSGRLYSSAFYALRDTRTPLRFAVIRVSLTLALGYICALPLPRLLGISQRWGASGLTLSAGIAGWLEFLLLRHALHNVIGAIPRGQANIARLWAVATGAALVSIGIQRLLPFHNSVLVGVCVLLPYGAVYIGVTRWMGIERLGVFNRIFNRRR